MRKKLIALIFVTVNLTLFSSQVLDKELYDLKPIPEAPSRDIPLLFTFIPKTKKTEIDALTQTWIKIDDALVLRASRAIELVTCEILRKIKNGSFKPLVSGNTCSYVLEDGWRVKEYKPNNIHNTYFLQRVIDVLFQTSIKSKSLACKPIGQKKLAPLNLKGLAHAKK